MCSLYTYQELEISAVSPEKNTKESSNKSTASSEANDHFSADEKLHLYRDMVRIRRFEERCIRSYQKGHIGGFCHTYIGQEALAVGTISVLGPDDQIVSAYRIHGHAIAVGMPMNELMAELYGKKTGCSKGKGGSMHFLDPERHFWGGHGIVGAHTPLGAGIAFALKYDGKKAACLCYLGDGAVNQGAFYESLNLAGLWDLPVIYVIENNEFAMGTSQERASAGKSLAERAAPMGIDWAEADGGDVYDVRKATCEALKRAYEKSRPTVLELHTYRYRGHSMSDPDQTYRTKEDIEKYKKEHDCIDRFADSLKKDGILDEDKIKEIDKEARAEAEAADKFADESEFPPPSSIQTDVFWELDHPEERKSKGTLLFNEVPEESEE